MDCAAESEVQILGSEILLSGGRQGFHKRKNLRTGLSKADQDRDRGHRNRQTIFHINQR